MTFALYYVRYPNGQYLYDYSINDLAGCYNDDNLRELISDITTDDGSIILPALTTVKDFYANEAKQRITNVDLTLLFTSDYANFSALSTSLLSDLQSAIPEHLV